ncbi:hypothetical protein PROFUN_02790 [Planoprotostelium fungivorum]|uniref:Uncharacterized protein n=1 Tax=Planoprotostelium fungivorum TaxID=1890364 RepID=A0A2P6NXL1_9EUKA|nr:hypothetical protein PROFUN_02790 [Planoprotostelium fungivorum]
MSKRVVTPYQTLNPIHRQFIRTLNNGSLATPDKADNCNISIHTSNKKLSLYRNCSILPLNYRASWSTFDLQLIVPKFLSHQSKISTPKHGCHRVCCY